MKSAKLLTRNLRHKLHWYTRATRRFKMLHGHFNRGLNAGW